MFESQHVSDCIIYDAAEGELSMRTTVTLDDALLAEAMELTGIQDRGPLLREALQALVQRESARRLAALGGTQPDAKPVPRRRPPLNAAR